MNHRYYVKPLCSVALLCGAMPLASASTAYGSLSNFDCVNDTGQETHGFEIEIEDARSSSVTYTYDYNHYGTPKITEDGSDPLHPKVVIRYASAKDAAGRYTAYTAIPDPQNPIKPTDGHQCTNPGVNQGCEHFGVGHYGSGPVHYFWLVDDGAGNLVRGPSVNVATPTWTYIPPQPAVNAPAVVQAEVRAPERPENPVKEFGEAVFVKEISTTTHNNNRVKLEELVSDDPAKADDKNWKNNEPDEVEVEFELLQEEFNKPDGKRNAHKGQQEPLKNGDEVVTRRYESYRYAGPYDPESNEALCDTWTENWTQKKLDKLKPECKDAAGQPLPVLGEYIGAQMVEFDPQAPLGLIEHLQDGDRSQPFPRRRLVIGGNSPYVATITDGSLPDGLRLNPTSGMLTGTPRKAGKFTFTVSATDANGDVVDKTYALKIVGAPVIRTSVLPTAGVRDSYRVRIPASGGYRPYTWQATDLPRGLRINANGVILGKAAKGSRGTYHPTIQVQDDSGAVTTKSLTLVVVP